MRRVSISGLASQTSEAVVFSARLQTAEQPDASRPRRNEKMSKSVRNGASRPVVYAVQVEKGLQQVRRLRYGQMANATGYQPKQIGMSEAGRCGYRRRDNRLEGPSVTRSLRSANTFCPPTRNLSTDHHATLPTCLFGINFSSLASSCRRCVVARFPGQVLTVSRTNEIEPSLRGVAYTSHNYGQRSTRGAASVLCEFRSRSGSLDSLPVRPSARSR